MNWDLIIFDCDGVLVDSEPISIRIFNEVLAKEGLTIVPEESHKLFTGYSLKTCLEVVEKHFGESLPKDTAKNYYAKLFNEFKKSLKPIPGINYALDNIPYPICVASSGAHEKMQLTLKITGLIQRFQNRIFSATDVEYGKPNPDLFLHAAKQCNALPEKCAVVEDSVPGISAGLSAGMTVFAYAGKNESLDPDALKKSGVIIFKSMKDLPKLLNITHHDKT